MIIRCLNVQDLNVPGKRSLKVDAKFRDVTICCKPHVHQFRSAGEAKRQCGRKLDFGRGMKALGICQGKCGAACGAFKESMQVKVTGIAEGTLFRENDADAQ